MWKQDSCLIWWARYFLWPVEGYLKPWKIFCSSKRFMISKVLLTYFHGPLKNFPLSHTTEGHDWNPFDNKTYDIDTYFQVGNLTFSFFFVDSDIFKCNWGWSDPAMFSYFVNLLSLPYTLFPFSAQLILGPNTTNYSAHPWKCCFV